MVLSPSLLILRIARFVSLPVLAFRLYSDAILTDRLVYSDSSAVIVGNQRTGTIHMSQRAARRFTRPKKRYSSLREK